jgi:hypothetical protein
VIQNEKPAPTAIDASSTTNILNAAKTTTERGAASTAEEIDLRRVRREHVHRHYSRVISLALSALDDGSQSPPPSRELIEWLLSALGFHCTEWTRLTDEELADFVGASFRLNEKITHVRILGKIRKQRERLVKWQAKEGNPNLFDYRLFFEHAEDSEPGRPKGKNYPEYRGPFGELIVGIIEEAPPSTRDDRLKRVVRRHVADYLARFNGTAKRDKRKKEHSPESDLNRAATVAWRAVEREEKKSGRLSALNSFCAVFSRKFSGLVRFESFDGKSCADSDLEKVSECGTCPPDFPTNRPFLTI